MAKNRNRTFFGGQQHFGGAQIVPMLVHPQHGIIGPAAQGAPFTGTQAGSWGGGGQGLNLQGVPGAKKIRKLLRTLQFGQDTNVNRNIPLNQVRGVPGAKMLRRLLSQVQGNQGRQFGGQGNADMSQILTQLLWQMQNQGQSQGQGFSGYGPQGYGRGRDDYSGYGPRGGQRNDDQIREDVIRALTDHPRIDARDIDVRVRNGEVTLEGVVPHREMKSETYRLVDRVNGVQQVFDNMRVQRDYSPTAQNRRQEREARQSAS